MSILTLREYVTDLLRANGEENETNFDSWLSSQGVDPAKTYSERLERAADDYARADVGFGANAEALARNGLSGSGYGAYLGNRAYSEWQRAKERAGDLYADDLKKSLSGYADYLGKKKAESDTLYQNVVNRIGSSALANRESAVGFAMAAGLGKEEAERAADSGIALLKDDIRKVIANRLLSGSANRKKLLQYAVARGLGLEEAEDLIDSIESVGNTGSGQAFRFSGS